VLAAGLAVAAAAAAPALAAPWSGLIPGKSKKPVGPQIPKEGVWRLGDGASQEIFANQGKAAVQVTAYVCVDPKPGVRSVVRLQMPGRPPIEEPAGCRNVELLVDAGDKVALVNPGPDGLSGSYKVADGG
jgi:hypothetical protein